MASGGSSASRGIGNALLFAQGIPEDGVYETRPSRIESLRQFYRLVQDREGGYPFGVQELVKAGSQDVPDARFQGVGLAPVERGDDPVQVSPHPQGAVDELGEQAPVPRVGEGIAGQAGVEQRFREGVAFIDPVQDFHGQQAGGLFLSHP